jgi:hypothetical protein
MTMQLRRVFLVGVVLVLGDCSALIHAQEPAQEESSTPVQEKGLRGVFLGKESEPSQSDRVVGRLAILLKTDDGTKRVRPDYSFRSGDHFQFEITANQDGWLYVMHASLGGDWHQLWPNKLGINKLRAGQSYEVPPGPGIFIFDKDTGNEFFYVAIRADPAPPTLGPSIPHARRNEIPPKTQIPASKTPTGETINFLVRDPFGETTRGVIFDPGKEDVDPYLYFSAAAQDTSKSAKVKFQLHHID